MANEAGKRALIVVSCTAGYTGEGKKGEYTIYNVEATTDDGTPVTLPLRSFDDLTPNIGKVVEYKVDPFHRQGQPTTYTLKGGEKPRLEARVKALEERVEVLERALEKQSGVDEPSGVIAPRDEDIPF